MKKSLVYISILMLAHPVIAAEPDTAFNNMFRKDIGGWIAADATFSILLPDGRTLWLFGDTFIGEVNIDNSIKSGSKFIRNSAVIQDGEILNTLYTGTPSAPSAFLQTTAPDSTWYWPEHGVVENDSLYIFVAKFREADNGVEGFNFEHAGNDIAVLTFPGLERIRTFPIKASAVNEVLYGDRVLTDTVYTYIYGRKNDPANNIPYPHVARALNGKAHSQEWEFFTGSGWSSVPEATSRINDFQVSQQYSVSVYRGKYILLTQDIWLSPKIFSFTSDSPTGPWSNKRLVYTTPETSGSTFTYNAYLHPQFNRTGEMLVSYNVNGDFWSIFNNVELYRPRFIRIPYMNLDFAFWPTTVEEHSLSAIHEIRVVPNPVRNNATLLFTTSRSGTARIEITDIHGRLTTHQPEIHLDSGEQQVELNLTSLPAGIYLCKVIVQQQIHTRSILKINRE